MKYTYYLYRVQGIVSIPNGLIYRLTLGHNISKNVLHILYFLKCVWQFFERCQILFFSEYHSYIKEKINKVTVPEIFLGEGISKGTGFNINYQANSGWKWLLFSLSTIPKYCMVFTPLSSVLCMMIIQSNLKNASKKCPWRTKKT